MDVDNIESNQTVFCCSRFNMLRRILASTVHVTTKHLQLLCSSKQKTLKSCSKLSQDMCVVRQVRSSIKGQNHYNREV